MHARRRTWAIFAIKVPVTSLSYYNNSDGFEHDAVWSAFPIPVVGGLQLTKYPGADRKRSALNYFISKRFSIPFLINSDGVIPNNFENCSRKYLRSLNPVI